MSIENLQRVASGWWLVAGERPEARGQSPEARDKIQNPKSKIQNSNPAARPGFTLTELLVVITIIAVLAGLITVAVLGALDTAKQTTIKTEIDQMDTALKALKEKYGAYPPFDLRVTNSQIPANLRDALKKQLVSFCARAFPRYDAASNAVNDISKLVDQSDARPDQALVFWLNGVNIDPANPFPSNLNALPKAMKKDVFYDFEQARLKMVGNQPSNGPALSYIPKAARSDVPFLYFDLDTLRALSAVSSDINTHLYNWNGGEAGYAWPYADDIDKLKWINADSFQIISAGMDGKYGASTPPANQIPHCYPSGLGYDPMGSEDDNVTNFCAKARLGDAKP